MSETIKELEKNTTATSTLGKGILEILIESFRGLGDIVTGNNESEMDESKLGKELTVVLGRIDEKDRDLKTRGKQGSKKGKGKASFIPKTEAKGAEIIPIEDLLTSKQVEDREIS